MSAPEIYCEKCKHLQDYATGMSEVWSQWACEAPSLEVAHENWKGKCISHRFFGFWNKPKWRNRKHNCPDFEKAQDIEKE